MKPLLLAVLLSAVLNAPLAAQTALAPTPAELREALPRFAEAWRGSHFQRLTADLTTDFALLVPTASFHGRDAVEARWHDARSRIGSVYLPGRFVRDGERILETGQAQLLFTVAADSFEDEPMCAPADAGYQVQPASYLREWVRTPDGSWKVKSLVLQ